MKIHIETPTQVRPHQKWNFIIIFNYSSVFCTKSTSYRMFFGNGLNFANRKSNIIFWSADFEPNHQIERPKMANVASTTPVWTFLAKEDSKNLSLFGKNP